MITSVARRTVVQSVNRASVFRPAVYRSVSTSVRSLSTYYTAGTNTQVNLRVTGNNLLTTYLPHLPKAHEYCKVDGNIATVGITDFAQAALGDIVFVDLPDVGDEFEAKDSFGSVESVKAASDVYAPVSGTIVEVNEALTDEPGLVNSNAGMRNPLCVRNFPDLTIDKLWTGLRRWKRMMRGLSS